MKYFLCYHPRITHSNMGKQVNSRSRGWDSTIGLCDTKVQALPIYYLGLLSLTYRDIWERPWSWMRQPFFLETNSRVVPPWRKYRNLNQGKEAYTLQIFITRMYTLQTGRELVVSLMLQKPQSPNSRSLINSNGTMLK